MSSDSVETSRSKVLDALNSRYTCLYEPLSARPDNNNTPTTTTTRRRSYLISLFVFGNREVVEQPQSPLPSSFCKLLTDQNTNPHIIKEKITNALAVISFREPRVLVQFWSPVAVRKRCFLTTLDQPFGFGVVDEGLYLYRLESEQRVFVVDEQHREELGPPGRVYRQKLPEWNLDVHGLSTRQWVQDWAACYNIHGYINMPVFEPDSGCCVGVLELITSSKYVDYAFEVREVSRALKEENLKSPNVFEDTNFYVEDERRQHELDEIYLILKMVCDIHSLPLAQTWVVSGYSSVVANSGNLERSCSSFSKSCIGKVCMSTTDALPFYIRDLSMWGFHEACTEHHLEKAQGVVGRSLSSRGLCLCRDITKLSEDEYPLVPYARVNGITSCLAIYLKSLQVDFEYVIEVFLPANSENEDDLQSLVKSVVGTLKQQIKTASRVQLGIMSFTQVIGGSPLSWNLKESLSLTENGELPPESNNEHLIIENEQNDVDVDISWSKKQSEGTYVEHMEEDFLQNEPSNSIVAGTSQNVVPSLEVGIKDPDINPWKTSKLIDHSNQPIKRKRKRTDRSLRLEEISKHYGKTMEEAAVSLNVSRSTLKRICRSLGIPRWPYKNGPDKSDTLMKRDVTDVVNHASKEAPAPVFGASSEPLDTTNITHAPATLTKYGEHSSTLVPHQQEQTNQLDGYAQPETTFREKYIENIAAITLKSLTVKATYKENIVKFPFTLSDGLVKLEELVAARFQIRHGSFSLKYVDEDGDMIMIACDNDLLGSLGAKPEIQTVIRLLVSPVVHHDG